MSKSKQNLLFRGEKRRQTHKQNLDALQQAEKRKISAFEGKHTGKIVEKLDLDNRAKHRVKCLDLDSAGGQKHDFKCICWI